MGSIIDTVADFGDSVNSIMLDSGAFSTFNKSASERETTKNRFYAFLKYSLKLFEDKIPFSLIMSFDAFADEDKFEDNFKLYELMSKYYPVTPVVHSIKNFEHKIDEYCKCKSEYIAIGKLSKSKSSAVVTPLVDKIHSVGKKCHLLGVTNYKTLSECTVETCDSKSWLDDSKSGVILYPIFAKNKLEPKRFRIPRKDGQEEKSIPFIKNFKQKKEFYNEMDKFGLSKAKFNSTKNNMPIILANLYYTQKVADFIKEERRLNPVESKNDPKTVSAKYPMKKKKSSK